MSIMAVRMCFFCVVLNTLYHNTSHRLSIITVKQFVLSDCCSSPISDCIHGFFFPKQKLPPNYTIASLYDEVISFIHYVISAYVDEYIMVNDVIKFILL